MLIIELIGNVFQLVVPMFVVTMPLMYVALMTLLPSLNIRLHPNKMNVLSQTSGEIGITALAF